MLSKSLLEEVHDLPSTKAVCVDRCRTRSLDIRLALSCHRLQGQGMDEYLCEIKALADHLKEVNSPLAQEDMVALCPHRASSGL